MNFISYLNADNYLRYERFVVALEEASRDMLPILKDKATKVGLFYCSLFITVLHLCP